MQPLPFSKRWCQHSGVNNVRKGSPVRGLHGPDHAFVCRCLLAFCSQTVLSPRPGVGTPDMPLSLAGRTFWLLQTWIVKLMGFYNCSARGSSTAASSWGVTIRRSALLDVWSGEMRNCPRCWNSGLTTCGLRTSLQSRHLIRSIRVVGRKIFGVRFVWEVLPWWAGRMCSWRHASGPCLR